MAIGCWRGYPGTARHFAQAEGPRVAFIDQLISHLEQRTPQVEVVVRLI